MAQEGSRAAFGELAERFGGRLTGFLVRRTRSGEAAEDLAQETLARAWQSLSRYDRTRRFSTWIFTIANRLAIDHYREGGRERAGLGVERAGQPDPTCAERHELSGRLWTIAQRVLTPEQTSALWLRYGADLDIGDIARVLGRTSVGVRVLLFRARERLAHELTEHEARRPVPAGIESKRSGGAP